MTYQKTMYCCSLCNRPYDNNQSAINCENLGIPQETSHIEEGQTVDFIRNITNEIGAVSNFVNQSGKVVHIEIMRNDRTNKHQHAFIVETEDEKGNYEGITGLLEIEGKPQMFMASSPRYLIGFGATIKKPQE